ncbi:MAG: gas vesicle protein GvpG [Methylococcales bacterium]
MLLVDDILFSPIKGINWIFKKVHELAQEELVGEADRLRDNLTELYMQLEAGQITEEEFEQQETLLLDRLDALDEDDNMIGDAEDDEEEDDEEDEEEDEDEEDESE